MLRFNAQGSIISSNFPKMMILLSQVRFWIKYSVHLNLCGFNVKSQIIRSI